MIHISNYGFFGEKLKPYADMNGYVPEAGDNPENGAWCEKFTAGEWKKFLVESLSVRADASAALDEWREPKIDRRRTVTSPGEPPSLGNPRFTVRAPRGAIHDWIVAHGGPQYLVGLAIADMDRREANNG